MDDSSNTNLDRGDRRILRLLQEDGRLTNVEIAKRANMSAATCHRRTQRLFEQGFIRSVRAVIDPDLVGLNTIALVGVTLDRSTQQSFADFEAAVAQLDMVLECYLVAGDFDYLLKIRVRDINAFNRLHSEELIALPGVRQARTFFVLKEVKDKGALTF